MKTIKDVINNKAKELFDVIQKFKIEKWIIEKTILTKEELDEIVKKQEFKKLFKDEQHIRNSRNIYLKLVKNNWNNFELLLKLLEYMNYDSKSIHNLSMVNSSFMELNDHIFHFNWMISCFDLADENFEWQKNEFNNLLNIFDLELKEFSTNWVYNWRTYKSYYVERNNDLLISLIFWNSLKDVDSFIEIVNSTCYYNIISDNYKNLLLDLIRLILNLIIWEKQIEELEDLFKIQKRYWNILFKDDWEVIIENEIIKDKWQIYYELKKFVGIEFNEEAIKLNEEIEEYNNKEKTKLMILEKEFDLFIDRLKFANCNDLVIKNIEVNKEEVIKEKQKELNLKEYSNICKFKIKDEYKELFN